MCGIIGNRGDIMNKYKIGDVAIGIVTGIEKYGIFVDLEDNYTGLIHISEVSEKFVANLKEYVEIGEKINVSIIDIDEDNKKLKLSAKNINYRIERKNTKIKETKHGFKTLESNLPGWIDKKINEIKNQ